MTNLSLPVDIQLTRGARVPAYATAGAAGCDLSAWFPGREDTPVILRPFERKLIPTGVRLRLPPGYEAQIRPRSGLALRKGLTVLNAPGTVDSDYRGEIAVVLANLGDSSQQVMHGDRIAQMIIAPVTRAVFTLVDVPLDDTERGAGGFGSSGA